MLEVHDAMRYDVISNLRLVFFLDGFGFGSRFGKVSE
jgi:hypothetical protein